MIVVNDAMVLIHLAKSSLLETTCDYFQRIVIPPLVYHEVTRGGHPDSLIIKQLIQQKKIVIEKIKEVSLLQKAYEFNIQRGEAEAVALYWELKADLLATDDDNVRKKKGLLQIRLIGTPVILLNLYKEKRITKNRLIEAMALLKKAGWFANTIWDKIQLEVENYE